MGVSLIITTYERPDALQVVLESVASQRTPPAETIVADDGSGTSTTAVVQRFAAAHSNPLIHVRQEHRGFRVTRLRNLAIRAASGDYLVFVDGDMLLHPQFVADHLAVARAGFFTQGVRIPLCARTTSRVLAADEPGSPKPTTRGAGLRRLYGMRAPRVARLLRRTANGLLAIKGCNQAYWRSDLLRVNGFNEEIEGWGPEDKELAARLAQAGVRRQSLLFAGIAWYLHHEPASRARRAANEQILRDSIANRSTRCARGLDSHQPDKTVS